MPICGGELFLAVTMLLMFMLGWFDTFKLRISKRCSGCVNYHCKVTHSWYSVGVVRFTSSRGESDFLSRAKYPSFEKIVSHVGVIRCMRTCAILS